MVTSAHGHARLAEGLQQLPGTRPPRHVLAHPADHAARAARATISTGRERHRRVVQDVLRRDHQVVADQLVGVLVGPDPAVELDQSALLGDPVRLGVDQRAVHVPQDRGRVVAVEDVGGVDDDLTHVALKYLASGWWTTMRVGRLLGVQLELLGQRHADALRVEQLDQLGAGPRGPGRPGSRRSSASRGSPGAGSRPATRRRPRRSRAPRGPGRATARPAPRSAAPTGRAARGSRGRRWPRTARRSPRRPWRPS